MYTFTKHTFEHGFLHLLWSLKGWLYLPGWSRLWCGNKEALNLNLSMTIADPLGSQDQHSDCVLLVLCLTTEVSTLGADTSLKGLIPFLPSPSSYGTALVRTRSENVKRALLGREVGARRQWRLMLPLLFPLLFK